MGTDILSIPGPTLQEMENSRQGTSRYTLDQMGKVGDQPTTLAPLEGTVQRRPVLETERGQSWLGLGEKESYFMQLIHGANNMIAGSGDLLINSFIDGVSFLKEDSASQGLDPKAREENPQLSRNYLQRFFNRGDYESIEYIFPKLADWFMENAPDAPEGSVAEDFGQAIAAWNKYGSGEQIGPPQNWQSRILRTGGQMGAASIPFIGAAGRTALATQRAGLGFQHAQKWATEKAATAGSGRLGDLSGALPILQQAITQPYRSAITGGTSLAGPATVEGLYGIVSGMGMQAETELLGWHTGIGALAPLALPASLMWLARHGPTGWAIRNIYAGGKKVVEMGQTKIADKKFEQDPSLIELWTLMRKHPWLSVQEKPPQILHF